ncbi:hypothetical protein AWC38_SpisGene19089 [Stylophora pistillata]|uniref:Reverse transcriptase domain-containing protein n=1 Tax=Stylophora pistillata TaxID=50429 RepID=A0A2B4RJS9_STYPI|nr:hypothetical protein AWC38_SpisGene19089 [Stylophora pistillata]
MFKSHSRVFMRLDGDNTNQYQDQDGAAESVVTCCPVTMEGHVLAAQAVEVGTEEEADHLVSAEGMDVLGTCYLFASLQGSKFDDSVQESSVVLYADDCKVYRVVNCANDLTMFQDDLDSLCAWSQRNRMTFNVKKCKMMRITRKKEPFRSSFILNGSDVEEVYEFRDLGLIMSHHLSWNSHVDATTNKAKRILGLLRRTCRGWKDTETLKMLYCTLVRSQVEYGTTV